MTAQSKRIQSIFLTVLVIVTSCTRNEKIEPVRETVSIEGIDFFMIRLPALEFPGGDTGTDINSEHRDEVLTIGAPFKLAETNTSYELWITVYTWAIEHGYSFNRPGQMGTEANGSDMTPRHPVTFIDWSSVAVWCNALTEFYNL